MKNMEHKLHISSMAEAVLIFGWKGTDPRKKPTGPFRGLDAERSFYEFCGEITNYADFTQTEFDFEIFCDRHYEKQRNSQGNTLNVEKYKIKACVQLTALSGERKIIPYIKLNAENRPLALFTGNRLDIYRDNLPESVLNEWVNRFESGHRINITDLLDPGFPIPRLGITSLTLNNKFLTARYLDQEDPWETAKQRIVQKITEIS